LQKLNPSVEEREKIVVALEAWKHHPDWIKGYAPGPGNFFKGKLYETPPAHHRNGAASATLELGSQYLHRQS
jgi:hypothetical protein